MKAAVYKRDGAPDVLRIMELAKPVPDSQKAVAHAPSTPAGLGARGSDAQMSE